MKPFFSHPQLKPLKVWAEMWKLSLHASADLERGCGEETTQALAAVGVATAHTLPLPGLEAALLKQDVFAAHCRANEAASRELFLDILQLVLCFDRLI